MQTVKERTVPDHVLAVLERMPAKGNVLGRITEQLDRKDYQDLNKVLEALGGKWVGRKVQGHVFPDGTDVAALVDTVLATGRYEDPKDADFVQTPEATADDLVRRAGVKPGMRVLEPQAGHGRIVQAIQRAGGDPVCVELSIQRRDALHDQTGIIATCADFLAIDPVALPHIDPRLLLVNVNAVVMNPPFSRQQDIDHVRHAFGFLKPGGTLVSIMGAGTAFRTNKKAVEFRAWVESLDGTIEPLPDGTFKAEGTMVRAVVVTVRRPA